MEKKSIEMIKSLLHPWDFSKPELDVGIDFIVWPNVNNRPLPKKFLVQLKSTNSSNLYYDFDLTHIQGWQEQNEAVIIVYINLKDEIYYYKWVDEIIVSTGNKKTQRVHFNKSWSKLEGKGAQAEIIQKLFPMIASSYQHTIDIDTGKTGMIAETGKLYGYSSLAKIDMTKIINDLQEQYATRERIRQLKEHLEGNPENQDCIMGLAIEYINSNDFNSAILEFSKLNKLGNPLGGIGVKILNAQDYTTARKLNGSQIRYYLQFINADYSNFEINLTTNGRKIIAVLDQNFRYILKQPMDSIEVTTIKENNQLIDMPSLMIAPVIDGILDIRYSIELHKCGISTN